METFSGSIGFLALAGVFLFAAFIVLGITFFIIRKWIRVASADEALVISGKTNKNHPDSKVSVVVAGKAIVNPITQHAEIISLRSRQVAMNAEAQSKDNITLNVEAVALVKIGSDPLFVSRAAERFASQDKAIEIFTTEQLEGALRGVVAKLDVAELMRDRKRFSEEIATDVSTDLAEQGLILDSFQIKGITDQVGYISSLGVPQIQAKRQAAEISEADAELAIKQRQIAVAEENLQKETILATNRERANATVGKERALAEQAEALTRSQAQQDVLKQEAANRESQLDADVKRVADAERYRREQAAQASAYEAKQKADAEREVAAKRAEAHLLEAEANAKAIQLEGEARAASIRAEAEALEQNREALLAQKALELLPDVVGRFAEGYKSVGALTIIGGGEEGASGHIAMEQAGTIKSSFETLKSVTGIDLAGLIQGSMQGQALGRGIAEGGKKAETVDVPSVDTTAEKKDADNVKQRSGSSRSVRDSDDLLPLSGESIADNGDDLGLTGDRGGE